MSVLVLMHLFASGAPRLVGPGFGVFSTGEPWACAAVGVAFALNALGYMWIFRKTERIPLRAQAAAVGPPFLACAPMVAIVVAMERTLAETTPPGARLFVEVAVGALAFVPSAWLLAPGAAREFIALLGNALGRRRIEPRASASGPEPRA